MTDDKAEENSSMIRLFRTQCLASAALAMVVFPVSAWARQSDAYYAAVARGAIGERYDGTPGARLPISEAVAAELVVIIKKRQAYFRSEAARTGNTEADHAKAFGCSRLKQDVAPGHAYLLPDNIWRIREKLADRVSPPIKLPDYCPQ